MAIKAEELIQKEANRFEKEIDKKLAAKAKRKEGDTFTRDGSVIIFLPKNIPGKLVLEEIVKRYESAGWVINYDVYDGDPRLFLTPKEIAQKEAE